MEREDFLNLLKSNGQEEVSEEQNTEKENPVHRDLKKSEKNPYSQQELNNFIKGFNVQIDPVANFTEIARKLGGYNRNEPVVENKVDLDQHDEITDVSPLRKNDAQETERLALKKLIAKYRG